MSEPRDIFYDDLDKPFHRPECQCDWCEEWRFVRGRSKPLRPGWMQKQLDEVSADFATWPEWMKREAVLRTPPVGTGGCE